MTRRMRIGNWDFAPDLHLLSREGTEIRLERKQAEVLSALAARAGEVLTRDELLSIVWGEISVTEEVLTNAIYSLRRAFEDDSRRPEYIQTIPRRGYRLVAEVAETKSPERTAQPPVKRGRALVAAAVIVACILAISGFLYGSLRDAARLEVAAIIAEAEAELDRGTPESVRRALDLYERAIAADSSDATALAGRALVLAELPAPSGASRASSRSSAERDAERALRIDPELSDPHVVLGTIRLAEWNWPAAEGHLRRAVEAGPRSARAQAALAEYLLLAGRAEEARRSAVLASRLAPDSVRVRLSTGFVHTMLRDDASAIADYRHVLLRDPGHASARRQIEKLTTRNDGEDSSPEALLRNVDSLLRKGEIRPAIVAGMFAEAGETDRALEWLERARDQKDLSILLVRLDDRWQKLHAEPRLQAILASVGPR